MTQTTPPAPNAGPRVTRREVRDVSTLRRATDDRMVAGVAEGISRHLDVDPLLIRVVLGAATFFGGAGLIFYLLAWWTIPADDEVNSIASRQLRRDPLRVLSAGLVIAGVGALITIVGAVGVSAPHPVPVIVISVLALIAFALVSRRSDGPRELPRPTSGAGPSPTAGTEANHYAVPGGPGAAPADAGTAGVTSADRGTDVATTATDTTTVMPTAYAPASQQRDPAWWQRDNAGGGAGDGQQPVTPGMPPPPRPSRPRRPRSHLFAITMAAIAIGVGSLWIVDDTTSADIVPSAYPATALGLIAVALIVGAWWGRSRLLIAAGIVATFATVVTSYAGPGPYGERVYTPRTATAVQSSYDHGVGRLVLHLEDVNDPAALRGRTIDLDSHIGQVDIYVPSSLLAAFNAHVDHGDINGLDAVVNGDDGEATVTATLADPDLTINVDLGFGEIVVHQVDCATNSAESLSQSPITLHTQGVSNDAPACN